MDAAETTTTNAPPTPIDFDGPIALPLPPSPPSSPPPPPSPALQSFLSVYELLYHLFTLCPPSTTSTCARTSKSLSAPALDALWRCIPRASYLFSLLGSLDGVASYDGHSTRRYDFQRDLHPSDWCAFLPYSRRVEDLTCSDEPSPLTTNTNSERWSEPSHKALARFAATFPAHLRAVDVFPRLRRLAWCVYSHKVLRYLPLFLLPSLVDLDLKIDNVVEVKPMQAFLATLRARCAAHLRTLKLNTDFGLGVIEEDVVACFEGMERLESVILPRFWITERILKALAALPALLYIGQRRSFWWGSAADTESGLLPAIEALEPGSFPVLRDMTYDTLSLLESRHLLAHAHGPKRLTALCVTSSKLEAPREVRDFLACLAASCPAIQDVDVGLTHIVPAEHKEETDITLHTLEPLHDLARLVHFGLATHFPVALGDAELDVLTRGLPRLKVLWLNETPAQVVRQVDVKSRLTLESLRIVARNCRDMQELSLFLDATTVPAQDPIQLLEGGEVQEPQRFANLRYLNLGVSHISSPTKVANFLVSTCTSPSSSQTFCFDCSPRFWPAPIPSAELESAIIRRRAVWEDVSKMIPALVEAEERMEAMRREMMGLINGLVLAGRGEGVGAGRE